MARKQKIEKPEEDKTFFEEKISSNQDEIYNLKTQQGKITLITKSQIIIEYGDGLGASIQFDPQIHSQLKVGDTINIP